MASPPPILFKVIPDLEPPLQAWDRLRKLHNDFGLSGKWVFRGISDSKHRLQTSLERAVLSLKQPSLNPISVHR